MSCREKESTRPEDSPLIGFTLGYFFGSRKSLTEFLLDLEDYRLLELMTEDEADRLIYIVNRLYALEENDYGKSFE